MQGKDEAKTTHKNYTSPSFLIVNGVLTPSVRTGAACVPCVSRLPPVSFYRRRARVSPQWRKRCCECVSVGSVRFLELCGEAFTTVD